MRILTAVIIWIVFIGGLLLFTTQRDSTLLQPAAAVQVKAAEETYSLAVTTSFALEPDPFAVQTDDQDRPAVLLVRLGEHIILRQTDRLEAGATLHVQPLSGLVWGANELYVEASPPLNQGGTSQALRVQILKDNLPVAEKTFWSYPGGNISDTFRFSLTAPESKETGHASH